jgi:hypothetical protein
MDKSTATRIRKKLRERRRLALQRLQSAGLLER